MHDSVNMDSVKEDEDINAEIREALDALTEENLNSWKEEEQEYTEADQDITCPTDGEHDTTIKEVGLQRTLYRLKK